MKEKDRIQKIKDELAKALRLLFISYLYSKETGGDGDELELETLKELNGSGIASLVASIMGLVSYLKEGHVMDHTDADGFLEVLSELDVSSIDEMDFSAMDEVMLYLRNEAVDA
ncbi:MAG: hypothetical protein GXO39_00460 [Thermotogae bacterium]|nr:hypothetical protein [Thermotogota bacterium]